MPQAFSFSLDAAKKGVGAPGAGKIAAFRSELFSPPPGFRTMEEQCLSVRKIGNQITRGLYWKVIAYGVRVKNRVQSTKQNRFFAKLCFFAMK